MPKYFVQASYTSGGMQGLLKDGGTTRKAAIEQLLTSVGGKLEVLYFGVGSDDIHMIVTCRTMYLLQLFGYRPAQLELLIISK